MTELDLLDVPLSDAERDLLIQGLFQWGGFASCSEEMAIALGFQSVEDLYVQVERLWEALRGSRPLSQLDWTRTLLATEVMFASDQMGAGVEWATVTGFTDEEAIRLLRGLQRKLVKYWVSIGTHPPRPQAQLPALSADERDETIRHQTERVLRKLALLSPRELQGNSKILSQTLETAERYGLDVPPPLRSAQRPLD